VHGKVAAVRRGGALGGLQRWRQPADAQPQARQAHQRLLVARVHLEHLRARGTAWTSLLLGAWRCRGAVYGRYPRC